MGRETFDEERESAFEGIGVYVVDLFGVHFIRNVHKGMRRGTSENSEVGRHARSR